MTKDYDVNLEYLSVWIAVGLLLCIVLVWNIILQVKLGRMGRQFNQLMGDTGMTELPAVMDQLHESITQISQESKENEQQVKGILETLKHQKGNLGVIRYNAFSDTGSDLSFSVALLDQMRNGVVISGLHHRESMYVYAKPLKDGESNYALSQEEIQAITLASQGK